MEHLVSVGHRAGYRDTGQVSAPRDPTIRGRNKHVELTSTEGREKGFHWLWEHRTEGLIAAK